VYKTKRGATRHFWFKESKKEKNKFFSGDNKPMLQVAAGSGVSNKSLLVYDDIYFRKKRSRESV
jgi:hypothetical protein